MIEKDPSYRLAASALSAASIRQQYSQPINIRMSLYGIEFLRAVQDRLGTDEGGPEIGLRERGYLYLAGESGAPILAANHAVQTENGADVVLLDPGALARRFPWLDTAEISLGSLGLSGEGWFDGWSLLQGFRSRARRLGADYLADEIVGVEVEGGLVRAVRLRGAGRVVCGVLVNCAGSGGPALARMAGIGIPVQAKRRSVFSFTCRTPLPGCPLLIDTTGVWMRPEGEPRPDGQTFISGWSPPAEHDPDWEDDDPASQEVDWPLFDDVVWPALAARVPALEAVRPGRAWAGPYDMSLFDHNPLIGSAGRPGNLYLCNGFSGHGLQHAPAVGRALAELIVHGRYLTLDLSELGPERVAAGRPVLERNVI